MQLIIDIIDREMNVTYYRLRNECNCTAPSAFVPSASGPVALAQKNTL